MVLSGKFPLNIGTDGIYRLEKLKTEALVPGCSRNLPISVLRPEVPTFLRVVLPDGNCYDSVTRHSQPLVVRCSCNNSLTCITLDMGIFL
jgi:hypothetical protein